MGEGDGGGGDFINRTLSVRSRLRMDGKARKTASFSSSPFPLSFAAKNLSVRRRRGRRGGKGREAIDVCGKPPVVFKHALSGIQTRKRKEGRKRRRHVITASREEEEKKRMRGGARKIYPETFQFFPFHVCVTHKSVPYATLASGF